MNDTHSATTSGTPHRGGMSRPGMVAKRLLDVVAAGLGLVFLWPFLLLIAMVVKLSSDRGPVLFSQVRSGLWGQPFTIYKFRTMVVGADRMRSQIAHLNEMIGPVFKLARDPRVTSVGRILRRLSLDELPQLWNVLKGEMSLVGPRPLPTKEAEACMPEQRRRMDMRPGLVCLWQVRGRSEIRDFEDWVRLDLEYVDNWSFWLDLKTLLAAVPAVLSGRGAK